MGDTDLAALEAEFAQVTAERDTNRNVGGKITAKDPMFLPIKYTDAYKKIRDRTDETNPLCWRKYLKALREDHPHTSSGCWAWFQTNISKNLSDDRDFVYCITTDMTGREHVSFDWSNETHSRLASTVYKKLMDRHPTSTVEPCGDHWLKLGFQGPNFLTDAGRLGAVFVMLQMLNFIDTAPKLASTTFNESRPPGNRTFSWALWGSFCSTRTINAFNCKKLNKFINKEKDVMKVLNNFYIGVWAQLFTKWCSKETREEMHDFNALKKEIEEWVMTKPDAVLKKATQAMAESFDAKKIVKTDGPPLTFTDLEEASNKKKKIVEE